MPIYEFACPKCRKVYSFLSRRIQPAKTPVCPKCGHQKLIKQVSSFALTKGVAEAPAAGPGQGGEAEFTPDFDDPRVAKVMGEMERDMEHLDERNPRHMAHLMRKMQQIMPAGTAPKEMEAAIRRLEAGEDPEKIEADMGDVLGDVGGEEGAPGGGGGYARDGGLYDY